MRVLPEINFLHLLLPVTLLLVGGWMTPTPSQGPPIPQGGGGLMGYDHDHGRGGGGGPGTWNIYIYTRWWFQIFFIFTPIWGLIFFKRAFKRAVQPLTSIQYNDYAFSGEFCLQVRNPEKVIPRLKRNGIFDSHWFGDGSDEKGSLVV